MASRIVQNSLLSAVAGGATLMAGFASTILVARLLGVAATGAVAYAIWLATMGVTLLDLGAQATLARYLPELRQRDPVAADDFEASLFRPYLAITLATVAVVGGLAVAFGMSPPGAGGWMSVATVGLLCVSQSLANYGLGTLRGRQAFRTAALTTLVSMAVQLLCVIGGALLFGEIGVLAGYGLGSAPLALRALWLLRRPAARSAGVDRRHLSFAAYTWAGGLASALVWSRSEVFFLQRSWGPEPVALLTAGFTFANLAAQGPMLLTGALLPFFSERVATDRAAVDRAFASGTRVLAFLALPLCFGAAGVMPALIAVVFGPHFAAASLPGSIIVIAAALAAPGAVGTHVMYARDRSDFIFLSNAVGAVLSVLAGIVVIPRYGLLGAACSRAAIQLLLVVWGFSFLRLRLKCPVPVNSLARLTVCAALCAASARLMLNALPGPAALVPAVVAGAAVYFISVRSLGALPEDDLARLLALQDRIPKALRWAPTRLASYLSGGQSPMLSKRHD
jgi:O-antigen/teichoic acid export membrane protein